MKTFGFRHPTLHTVSVPLGGLGQSLRVAHLTDLHVGMVTPRGLLDEAVRLTNEAEPDLVVLTGDYVARSLRYLHVLTDVLSRLNGRRIATLGNHDHWAGADRVVTALEAAGVEVLSNGWTTHGSLAVVGLDDHGTGNADVLRATAGLEGRPALGLSHNPEAAPELWACGVSVVLSGHTHAGQLHIPKVTRSAWKGMLGARYVDGWYEEPEGRVYVNPGVGSSVVPWRAGRPAHRAVAMLELEGGG